ncbi:hypothetical protein N7462_008610 [Penicillium macrosclerotiorum]|uniref:uncharacterized protein n=1 Tax=Penicillium macrosclerotiorum TaxID=303699 RepID=UPI002546D9E1|nr:uncharacterized protein N7462_008610 [Penicillium macrosclerotiorum]KAJ5675713.1 hypothetical protein N7462_008610 [Penicillium macrosclerotiorum]
MASLFEFARESASEVSADPHLGNPVFTDDLAIEMRPIECNAQNITGKVFLNRPVDNLVPPRFLHMAHHTTTVQRKPWIFRGGAEDARKVNMGRWSKVDIRYRGVFKTLAKVPRFQRGLWEDGSEDCQDKLDEAKDHTQDQVIYALLNELGEMMNLKRDTAAKDRVFSLGARLVCVQMEYWTGYRKRYNDGPMSSGFLSLACDPDPLPSIPIVPVSTVRYPTTIEESLQSSLSGKFKLMLGQLLRHVKSLSLSHPGDKIPDQEIFLIGLHGSRMHLLRGFFPGQKLSSLWCQREITMPIPTLSAEQHLSPSSPSQSPTVPTTAHIEHFRESSSSPDNDGAPCWGRTRSRRGSDRFYTAENIERLRRHFEATRLSMLDHEPDLHTFRVLGTREYDLWRRGDFAHAVHMLVALQMYLLSGEAQCGILQELFAQHPAPAEGGEAKGANREVGEEGRKHSQDEFLQGESGVGDDAGEEGGGGNCEEGMQTAEPGENSGLRGPKHSRWDVWQQTGNQQEGGHRDPDANKAGHDGDGKETRERLHQGDSDI